MAEKTIKHVIRFPEDVYNKLRKLADLQDRSINSQVIASLRQVIDQYEREHGTIEIA
jgi:hypothetical protein